MSGLLAEGAAALEALTGAGAPADGPVRLPAGLPEQGLAGAPLWAVLRVSRLRHTPGSGAQGTSVIFITATLTAQ